MLTPENTPFRQFEEIVASSLPASLDDAERDLVLRGAVSAAYKALVKVMPPQEFAQDPAAQPGTVARRPMAPIQRAAAHLPQWQPPPPITQEWDDAMFMAFTRDTRVFINQTTDGIPTGDWYDIRPHLMILYTLAKWVCWLDPSEEKPIRPPKVVEIGVRHGVSTLALLTACRETGGNLTSIEIDPEWADNAMERVVAAKLADWWTLLVMHSDEAIGSIEGPIDVLWIDGAHELEQVRKDFSNYAPRVRQGGFIIMHDYYRNFEPLPDNGVSVVVEEARATMSYEVLVLSWSYGLALMRVV